MSWERKQPYERLSHLTEEQLKKGRENAAERQRRHRAAVSAQESHQVNMHTQEHAAELWKAAERQRRRRAAMTAEQKQEETENRARLYRLHAQSKNSSSSGKQSTPCIKCGRACL